MTKVLSAWIDCAFMQHAKLPALLGREQNCSYEQLFEEARIIGRRVGRVAPPRSSVAIKFEATDAAIATYLAVVMEGHVPFLVDPAIDDAKLDKLVHAYDITYSIDPACTNIDGGLKLNDNCLISGGPNLKMDTEVCRFTSGTTSLPKCLEFSGAAVRDAGTIWADQSGLIEGDRILCVTPFSNGLAFNTSLLSAWSVGAAILAVPAGLMTARAFFSLIEKHRITRVVGFPTFYRRIVNSGALYGGESVTHVISAASSMGEDLRRSLDERYSARVIDYYGIAEVGPVTDGVRRAHAATLGSALVGNEIRIEDGLQSGRLEVRTPYMATTYLGADELFSSAIRDGFFVTGDVGKFEVNGELVLTGRSDRVFKVGGKAIDPALIEGAARATTGVSDAAVVVNRTDDGEELIHLYLVAENDLALIVKNRIREDLGRQYVPSKIIILPELPRNGAGKIIFP